MDAHWSPHPSILEGITIADVTLRQLRYFAALGTELNYRRAADKLFITQPALSTAIKQLEHQFGVVLFIRNTREVALTDLGAAWLPQVQQALAGIDAVVGNLVTMSGTQQGVLRLGYLIGTGADLLFRIVRHFETAHPGVVVEPSEYDFADPTAGLGDGSMEVALIRPPVDLPEHRMMVLDAESWVACLPRDHQLATRTEVDITELLDEPIVCAPMTAGGWRDYWLAMDVRGNRPPTIAGIAATYEAETTMVARGLGISFTTSSVAHFYDRPGIVYVPITGRPPSYTALAWHPARLSPQAEALVSHVQKHWNSDDERD
ncbi:LysR family transcriptional regulator [Mycolicibacterium sarraceniae]|uniref:Probable hydrogen peroxide-inducible genes activator n=1 Tax=Mycolicibacterium sarraceniae TaxID=1534348 RepID=A0A7I7SY93_9MYCO|nr:LysR family transcriptional regulator [Mycolicibacterium sarraceniae]BBY61673.1 LysR family transcriptional regulator [Mycolicibacterium sarraceniae]